MDDCRNGAFSRILLQTTSTVTYTISSLTPGSICRYRMKVENIIGASPYSDILSIQYAVIPGSPPVPSYVARSGGDTSIGLSSSISIKWDGPVDNGGVSVLGYQI